MNDIISRSDATALVKFYFDAIGDNEKKFNGDLMYFNDQCRRARMFPDMPRAHWNKVIPRIFKAIDSLDEYIYFKDIPDISNYDDLEIDLPPGENTMFMLHHAVDNYNYKWERNKNKRIDEDLHDCFIEKNTCAICQIFRNGAFYFSTMYGLDIPVCSFCIDERDSGSETNEDQYSGSEEDSESESEEELESDTETESETYNDICDEDTCGCTQCKNYIDGWNSGWSSAMKYIKTVVKENTIPPTPPSKCTNCYLLCNTRPNYLSE
jgi:hypothetical protein